jgi:glutamate carboxypeptidase
MKTIACVAAVLLQLSSAAIAADLSLVEQRIVEAVKARKPEALALLERSVNINSGTMNQAGVRETGSLFRAEFDALGFQTHWIEMPAAMQRAGHLVATREGARGKRVLLIGHLDTVFEKDSAVQAWKPVGRRIAGQGVSDMKGGDVIVIEALRALKAAGALDGSAISVIFTGDEEHPGTPIGQARAELVALARRSDVALAFEGMIRDVNGVEYASVARRAAGSWTLNVTGRQGHSAGVFGPLSGFGAAYEMARILNDFREQLREPDLTFSPGLVLAGTEVAVDDAQSKGTVFGKRNVIPPTAVVTGDLRYLTAEQRERTYARMREIVGKNLQGTSASIKFNEAYPPMSPTPVNEALLNAYSQASIDAGLGKIETTAPSTRGAGDVQFVAPFVDCLDGLGASGGGAHTPDEYLNPESIERNTIRAALLIYRLTKG